MIYSTGHQRVGNWIIELRDKVRQVIGNIDGRGRLDGMLRYCYRNAA
ncbi:MAG: hypothetical protein HOH82_09750 [Planctomycetaceae bacterium]|nr:hypothetical protein [Planctomycetaceae bacterium]